MDTSPSRRAPKLWRRLWLAGIGPLVGGLLLVSSTAAPAGAAAPGSGTIGPNNSSVSWTGQLYAASSVALPDQCPPAVDPVNLLCDHFYLTVDVPETYWDTNHGGAQVGISWADATNDFDLYVYDKNGNEVGRSAGQADPEVALIPNANSAASPYEVRVVPFLVIASNYNGTATFASAPGSANPSRSTGGLAFGPATVIDAQRTEGEPINHIDATGAYWESGPWGTSTQQSFIHRSTDGGDQFNIVTATGLRPDSPPGGGDTDVVTDDQGFVYFTDLEALANLDCAVSYDQGDNWVANHACVANAVVDRQWYAVDNGLTSAAGDNTIFLGTRQELGTFIYSSPGSTGLGSDGGLLFSNSTDDPLPLNEDVRCGKLVFDPVNRNLYYPCAGDTNASVTIGHVAPGQRTGIVYHNVQLPTSPGGGGVDDLFPLIAVDAAGNVYGVWVDTNDHTVYYSYSTDQGETWSTPVHVSGNDANSNVMPWAIAGADGTLVVVWYGSPSHFDSDLMPSWYNDRAAATAFPWYGYVSVVRSAASGSPSFVQQRFTEKPMHYGQICTGGIGCTISDGDRTMADFFAVTFGPDGSLRIVYNDTTTQHHGAHIFEERQLGGPNALTGRTVSKPAPKNPMTDATNDAHSPHYGPSGAGPNLPQLDFTQLKLSQPNSSTLRVEMTLSSLLSKAPPSGKTKALWLTRFQALSVGDQGEAAYRLFYVGAESNNGGNPTFFAGSGVSADGPIMGNGCITNTPENCKVMLYPSEVTATGSVSGNVIRIDVPIQGGFGVNRPIYGTKLFNVTAVSGGRNADSDPVYADVDATRAYDFALGSGTPPPPPGGSGRRISGGGTITTSSGSSARFALDVFENLVGKIDYRDGTSASFRSTRILSVTFDHATNTAHISGTGVSGGAAVDFEVSVVDNGEPGTADAFGISLSSGYSQSGTLTSGNIQFH